MSQFKDLSLNELKEARAEIDSLITQKQIDTKNDLLAEFKKKADDLGIDFNDLIKVKAPKSAGTKLSPKYRNPNNPSQTWSGRGKPQKWFTELIDSGVKKEDLLIKS